jgi:uncharacterized protein YehS (DUF1456 family)
MINNDILRSIRYMLDLSDNKVIEIIRLADPEFAIEKEEVRAFLLKEDEPGHVACSDRVMAHFLNGLVVYRRGKDESRPPAPVEVPVTNNTVLKKLRAAFELKDDDIIAMLAGMGLRVSKAELGAFFRRRDHRNYRECGDQFLRNFLRGLTPSRDA